eukprot:10633578-Heterocapsa_arctica.AAC.1
MGSPPETHTSSSSLRQTRRLQSSAKKPQCLRSMRAILRAQARGACLAASKSLRKASSSSMGASSSR